MDFAGRVAVLQPFKAKHPKTRDPSRSVGQPSPRMNIGVAHRIPPSNGGETISVIGRDVVEATKAATVQPGVREAVRGLALKDWVVIYARQYLHIGSQLCSGGKIRMRRQTRTGIAEPLVPDTIFTIPFFEIGNLMPERRCRGFPCPYCNAAPITKYSTVRRSQIGSRKRTHLYMP
jgi:hypothetical protein